MQQQRETNAGDAEIVRLAAQCVMCGLCLPHCPSYRVERNEADSPRGRLALMAALATGQLGDTSHPSLDRCMGCGACEPVCPPKVQFLKAMTLTRATRARTSETAIGRAARQLARSPRFAAWLIDSAVAVRRWLPAGPRRRLNLDGLASIGRPHLPKVPARRAESAATAVTVLAGCAARTLEARTVDALRVLAQAWKLDVQFDRDRCCGAIHAHLGQPVPHTRGQPLAGQTHVVVNSGCASSWQQGLATTPVEGLAAWLDRMAAANQSSLQSQALRIALHVPCSQALLHGEAAAMARLIGRIPGAQLLMLPTQPKCCGAAATYFLNQPAAAQALAAELAASIRMLQPDLVVSANGGCRAHLAQALHALGSTMRVVHPAELLAENLMGKA